MGACDFENWVPKSEGLTMDRAFDECVQHALWEYGHGGYTGTIAEKDSYRRILVPEGVDGVVLQRLIEESDTEKLRRILREDYMHLVLDWYADKWEPALAYETDTHYVFFGLASS